MFCPRCSQEQISGEVKFCSRCGFLLTDVAEALQNNGKVERNVIQSTRDLKISVVKGITVMVFSLIFLLLSLVFGTPEPSHFVQFNLLVGLLFFLFGTGLIAYNFWIKPVGFRNQSGTDFVESDPPAFIAQTETANHLLKEPDLSEVVGYAAPQNSLTTNDLVGMPTVTEDTTRALHSRLRPDEN